MPTTTAQTDPTESSTPQTGKQSLHGLQGLTKLFISPTHKARVLCTFSKVFGNAIRYYADPSIQVAQVHIGTGDDPGVIVAANASIGPQRPLWSKTGLGPGDHQITIRHAGITGRSIGLDYFLIESDHGFTPSTTGPAASSVPSEALFVDSTSSDLIFTGNWTTDSSDTQWAYYGGSITRSQTPGSTITFKFTGTAVWYYAAMFNRFSGTANISLDGGPADVINTHAGHALLQRLLWSKTGLSDGEHTVVLEHVGTESTFANLDFFRYLPSGNSSSSPTTSQPQKSSSNAGAIVGGVIGGLGLVAILIFLFVYLRRRRAEQPTDPDLLAPAVVPTASSVAPTHVTPFEATPRSQWGYAVGPGPRLSGSSSRTPPVMAQARLSKGSSGLISTPPQPRLSYDHSIAANEGVSESGRTGVSSFGLSDVTDGPPPYVR
ncbi:hypothetical protein FRC12_015594 [Ceratobasidium sp. 428]|nr:hypothetical protein FRC12_015594 [Ceratobasidium sp. 428]